MAVERLKISTKEASRIANEIWGGVYLVRRVQGGFEVILHSATGPRHLLDDFGIEVRRDNPGVPDEGPVENLRNAAAIIQANLEIGDKDALTADDAKAVLARIRTALQQLKERRVNMPLSRRSKRRIVRRGNPALAILGANPRIEDATIATWAKIEYRRPDDPDGKNVIRVHEFKDGFEIGWLSDGTVQLSHPKHPLWTEDGS